MKFKGDSSNKASQKPKSPDAELFKHAVPTTDGKVIWRSIPQPDRIAFTAPLMEEHFGKGGKKPLLDAKVVKDFAEGLGGAMNVLAEKAPHTPSDGIPKEFKIPFGPREANAFVLLKKTASKEFPAPTWTIRLEYCPRKLKPDGHNDLLEALYHAGPSPFHVGALLRDARLQRLDVAVDLFSVTPDALLVTSEAKGKRQEIFGPEGRLESLYLYGAKKPPKEPLKGGLRKPYGSLILRVYDRNAERRAHGKPPPYANGTTTRLEATVTRFGKPTYLPDLPKIANPFRRASVSPLADVLAPINGNWRRYWAARRAFGADGAHWVSGLAASEHKLLDAAVKANPSILLPQPGIWLDWEAGLKSSGLSVLVDSAMNKV